MVKPKNKKIEIFIDDMEYPKHTFYEARFTRQNVTDDEVRLHIYHEDGDTEIFLKTFSYQIVCHAERGN